MASGDEVFEDGSTELSELLETAGMVVGELVVVESEQAQEGHVLVPDLGFAFDGGHAKFVCGTDGMAGTAASSGEPDSHGVGMTRP